MSAETFISIASNDWDNALTWDGPHDGRDYPQSGDKAILRGDNVTLTSAQTVGTIYIESDATLTGGGFLLTCDEGDGNPIFDHDGTIVGILNVKITGDTNRDIDLGGAGSTGNVNHLEIDSSGQTFTMGVTATLDGNLTVTAGTFDTDTYDLTVQVAASSPVQGIMGAGTLAANSSTITIGGVGGDVQSQVTGVAPTFTGDGGTVINKFGANGDIAISGAGTINCSSVGGNWTDAGTTTVNIIARSKTCNQTGSLYNLILDNSGGTTTLGAAMTILGDLTITAGTLDTSGTDYDLTVTGQTILTGTLTCNASDIDLGAGLSGNKFGLSANTSGIFNGGTGTHTIWALGMTGGTITLSSGITTLTGKNSSTSGNIYFYSGTFNHGSGTLVQNYATQNCNSLFNMSITFNNFILNAPTKDYQPYTYNKSLTIAHDGDLTITAGDYITKYTTHPDIELTVDGDVLISDGGTLTGMASTISFGSLTIAGGGTYSATSGVTTILAGGTFSDGGTYTHNNGTFAVEVGTVYVQGTSETAFYDVASAAGSGIGAMAIYTDKIIEHDCSEGAGTEMQIKLSAAGQKLTFGTDSHASDVDITYLDGTDALTQYIYSASELKPAVIPSTCDYPRFLGIAGQSGYMPLNAHIKWLDIQKDLSLPEAAKKLILDGDCSFAAVTVGENNTLDLNGKRMECSGIFTNSGAVDADQSGEGLTCSLYCGSFMGVSNTDTDFGGCDVIINGLGGANANDFFSFQSYGANNVMINTTDDPTLYPINQPGTRRMLSGDGDNLIIAQGGWQSDNFNVGGNLTIATGGKLNARTYDYTLDGDFNMAGGLIGKSAIDLNGSSDRVALGTQLDSDITTSQTWEAWVKPSDTSSNPILANDSVTRGGYLRVDTGARWFLTGLSGVGYVDATSTIVADKWVHIAGVYDGSYIYLYINGKLEAKNAVTGTVTVGQNMWMGHHANNDTYFNGVIGRVSVWDAALTAAQIRTMMFQNFTDATTTDCVAWYQFDEGTGTDVADSSGSGFDGTYAGDSWAGGGDFTRGTSTIDLTGTGDFILPNGANLKVYNLTMAASTKTTTMVRPAGASMNIYGTHTVGAGTYSQTGDPNVTYQNDSTVVDGGAGFTGNHITYWSSTTSVPAATFRYFIADQAPTNLGGDMVCTGYFRGAAYTTNTNNYQVTTPNWYFDGSTTMNIGSSTIILNSTTGVESSSATSVLTAGPGCVISGTSAGTTFKSQNDWTVVGKCENLNVTNEELNVTGKVINCTGDIIQQHQSVDAAQQLDYDSADDRDIMLGRDLDKNTELVG